MSMAPWHMWGTTVNVTLPPNANAQSGQLSRISYHRPESWRFLFYARILRSQIAVAPQTVIVLFNVAQGVGRGNVQIQNFEQYLFSILLSGEQGASNPKFSTQVAGPARVDSAPPGTTGSVVDTIVAQDIQVSYSAFLSNTGVPTDQVQMEIGSMLTPWHHARPDWMVHHFHGEELDGK